MKTIAKLDYAKADGVSRVNHQVYTILIDGEDGRMLDEKGNDAFIDYRTKEAFVRMIKYFRDRLLKAADTEVEEIRREMRTLHAGQVGIYQIIDFKLEQ